MSLSKGPLGPAFRALRTYLLPFLCMQVCAAGIVAGYYHFLPFKAFCTGIAQWKVSGGLFFSATAGAITGGIIPELAKLCINRFGTFNSRKVGEILYHLLVFAIFGIIADFLYRFQAIIFGNGIDLKTLSSKVFVDQFIFNPVLAAPFFTITSLWKEKNFSLREAARSCDRRLYMERIIPILIPNWLYWIPMASCIYSLPSDLQFPFWTCVVSAWYIILIFILADTAGATPPSDESLPDHCAP